MPFTPTPEQQFIIDIDTLIRDHPYFKANQSEPAAFIPAIDTWEYKTHDPNGDYESLTIKIICHA